MTLTAIRQRRKFLGILRSLAPGAGVWIIDNAMTSISFYFGNVHAGFSSCTGILHVTGDGLRCEYKVDIGGLGLKSATREAEIRFEEIESIEFRRTWFKGKAVIRPKSLKLLDRFPASGDDAILLYFKRKDRSKAEYLLSELSLQLSQSRLDFYSPDSAARSAPALGEGS